MTVERTPAISSSVRVRSAAWNRRVKARLRVAGGSDSLRNTSNRRRPTSSSPAADAMAARTSPAGTASATTKARSMSLDG